MQADQVISPTDISQSCLCTTVTCIHLSFSQLWLPNLIISNLKCYIPSGLYSLFISHTPIWTGESCTSHCHTVNHLIGHIGFITPNSKQKSKSTTTELEWNKFPTSYCQITVLSLNEWCIKIWSLHAPLTWVIVQLSLGLLSYIL